MSAKTPSKRRAVRRPHMPAVPPYREKVLAAAERQRLIEGFDLLSAPAHLLRRCHQRAREIFDGLIGNYRG